MSSTRQLLCCVRKKNKVAIGNMEESSRPTSRITWAGSSMSMTSLYNRAKYRLPIDERDMILLSKSWESVEKSIEKAGVLMFMEMFEHNPDVKPVFQKFIGLEQRHDLITSSVFQTHGLVVMNAMNDIIIGLYDKDDAVDQIIQQGRSHAYFQNMKASFFWAMEKPFIAAIKSTLSGVMSEKIEKLYRKLIHFVLECLVAGFQMEIRDQEEKKRRERDKRKGNGSVTGLSINEISRSSNTLEVPR